MREWVSVCECVCVCVCVCVFFLCVCVYVYVCVCLNWFGKCVCVCVCVARVFYYLCVCVCVSERERESKRVSVCVCVCMCVCVCVGNISMSVKDLTCHLLPKLSRTSVTYCFHTHVTRAHMSHVTACATAGSNLEESDHGWLLPWAWCVWCQRPFPAGQSLSLSFVFFLFTLAFLRSVAQATSAEGVLHILKLITGSVTLSDYCTPHSVQPSSFLLFRACKCNAGLFPPN